MAGPISFNPMVTTGVSGAFVQDTQGFVQGTFLDDFAVRSQLEGGVVASAQSTPIWGGLPLTLAVPNLGANPLGPALSVASALSGINAWCLFNQASAGILTSSSNVPLYSSGMTAHFGRVGSNLRIVLSVHSTVVDSLEGAAPNVDLYWDPVNLYLTTSSASTLGPLPVQLEFLSVSGAQTVAYASGSANWVTSGNAVAVVRI